MAIQKNTKQKHARPSQPGWKCTNVNGLRWAGSAYAQKAASRQPSIAPKNQIACASVLMAGRIHPMPRPRYAWVTECSKGHRDVVYGYDPDHCPGLPFCDWNVRDEAGRIVGKCNGHQTWERADVPR